MTMTNMQDCFWEVALTKSRDQFLKGKQAAKLAPYVKNAARPVRLDRSYKSTIFAAAPTSRRNDRLNRLAGR